MTVEEKYRICIIVPEGNPHAACFTEVGVLLKSTFLSAGISCDITLNDLDNERINIILGANLLDPRTFSPSARYIIYQLEQLSDDEGWYTDSKLSLFEKAFAVWDYSLQNIVFLKSHGIFAHYLPLGYHPALEQIKVQTDRDIDILFFGSRNGRREEILNTLHQQGLNVKALFGLYGNDRDAYIARSKIILNIHFYSVNIFEAVRVSYLLNNRCFIVSEESSGYPYEGVSIPLVPYDDIIETCTDFLNHRDEMDEKRERMYSEFKELYPMEKLLKNLLNT